MPGADNMLDKLIEQAFQPTLHCRTWSGYFHMGKRKRNRQGKGPSSDKTKRGSLSVIKKEHLVVVDLDGNKVEGDLKPSTDTPTHLVLYRAFKDIGGIVHTHSSGQVLCPGRKRHTRLWRSLVQIIQKETTTIDRKLKNSIRT